MNILQINNQELRGGAARVMLRLHNCLIEYGHHSEILFARGKGNTPNSYKISDVSRNNQPKLDLIADRMFKMLQHRFGIQYTKIRSTRQILTKKFYRNAQIVHFHNLHGDYFNYHLLPIISKDKPIVWTLHDMWAFTGHCAYSYDCEKWKVGCHKCPLLQSSMLTLVEPKPPRIDTTRQRWHEKKKLYQSVGLHIVTPSQWMHKNVDKSILSNASSITTIPNAVDLEVFHPIDQSFARQALKISPDDKVILFVANSISHRRKGFDLLVQALERIEQTDSITLLIMGDSGQAHKVFQRFRQRNLGFLSDEHLINLAYNAADVFVFPTLFENHPLVLLEALASSTPVVSFEIGGVPEIVQHMENGYLANYKDPQDLSVGIMKLLKDEDLHNHMRIRCRKDAVEKYSLTLQTQRYLSLYEQVMNEHKAFT